MVVCVCVWTQSEWIQNKAVLWIVVHGLCVFLFNHCFNSHWTWSLKWSRVIIAVNLDLWFVVLIMLLDYSNRFICKWKTIWSFDDPECISCKLLRGIFKNAFVKLYLIYKKIWKCLDTFNVKLKYMTCYLALNCPFSYSWSLLPSSFNTSCYNNQLPVKATYMQVIIRRVCHAKAYDIYSEVQK